MSIVRVLRFAKQRLGVLWWHSLLLFVCARAGDLVSMSVGLFLVPDVLSQDKLGMILPLVRFAGLMGVPLNILGLVARKYISVFSVRSEQGKIKSVLRDLALLNAVISVAIICGLFIFWRSISAMLKIEDNAILWILAALAVVSCWGPVLAAVAQGLRWFYRITIARVLGPVARLVVILLLLSRFQVAGFLLGTLAQPLSMAVLLAFGLRRYMSRRIVSQCYREHIPEMTGYLWPMGATTLFMMFQLAMEPWVIRQYFPSADSAGYYMAAMFGSIPMWVGPAMMPFLFPLASEQFERGQSTMRIHRQALLVICVIGLCICLALLLAGRHIMGLRQSWSAFTEYSPYMSLLGLIASVDVLMKGHTMHEAACRRFGFLKYYIPVIVGEFSVLFTFLAHSQGNTSMAVVIGIMLISRVVIGVCIALEVFRGGGV